MHRRTGFSDQHELIARPEAPNAEHPTMEGEGVVYEGFRYDVNTTLAARRYADPFGVDVAYADVVHGPPDELVGSDLFSFIGSEPVRVRAYPAGSDAEDLAAAIGETFAFRATHPVPTALADPPPDWVERYRRMARDEDLPWRELEQLLVAARAFLDPVLASASGRWDPKRWTWTDDQG